MCKKSTKIVFARGFKGIMSKNIYKRKEKKGSADSHKLVQHSQLHPK